jgi:hypothetical protein
MDGIREFKLAGRDHVAFWCPGCRCIHWVPVDGSRGWGWNSATLTLQPSIRQFYTDPETKQEITTCHYFVRNGKIDFLGDSSAHQLRGVHPLDQAPPADYGGRESFGW